MVTGASSGIGDALVRESVARGMDVVLCARRQERLNDLAAWVTSQGRRALVVVCDVTQPADCERAVSEAITYFGQIDVVIANAGFGVVGQVFELTIADYERQFATNVYGVLNTFYATWEALKKSKGNFAAVGSVNGYVALPGNSAYAMSKFAVRGLCDSLRLEAKAFGVSVTHIAPGFVRSEIRKVSNDGKLQFHAKDPVPDWIQMPADKAARQILRAVTKRRAELIVTFHGKVFAWWARHFPRSFRFALGASNIRARPEAELAR